MDFRLKNCFTDRLSSLPDDLICHIHSLLLTKDAAALSFSSKKMRTFFRLLTILDFGDSAISYCVRKPPKLMDRFQFFKSFVDNVLQTSQSPHIIRFRLKFGGYYNIESHQFIGPPCLCDVSCLPDLDSTRLNAWICFPLARGAREIDLRIHVMKPGKLPSAIFASETLEVLKIDTNLSFDIDVVLSMPSCRLPNLKVLDLREIHIPEDDFLSRLLPNFPSLEELHVDCYWKYANSVTIASPSLQKLVLYMNKKHNKYGNFLCIDTPNLRYLLYDDNLVVHYSMSSMNALVEASFNFQVWGYLDRSKSYINMLSLVRAVFNVQRLSLMRFSVVHLDSDELTDQLPVFQNLKQLVLGPRLIYRWNTVLFAFLRCSPLLETLEFPMGFVISKRFELSDELSDSEVEAERQLFRSNQVSSCWKPFLKKIVIKMCRGTEREVDIISFLLKHAPVLEELMVTCCWDDEVDRPLLKSTLVKVPRASFTCLIIVQ